MCGYTPHNVAGEQVCVSAYYVYYKYIMSYFSIYSIFIQHSSMLNLAKDNIKPS
jgi:hypothetical protein